MGTGENSQHFYPLTSLQIGLSPFANTRTRREGKDFGKRPDLKGERWFPLIDAAALSHKKALLPVKKLRNSMLLNSKLDQTLYGFIVFEVTWTNIRGINYLNELQTDTSMAIEAKVMKRWEFDSIEHALSCISSWFVGTDYECLLLRKYLDSIIGEVFYDAQEDFLMTDPTGDGENICNADECIADGSPSGLGSNFRVYPATTEYRTSMLHTPPPPPGPYKRRKTTKSISSGGELDSFSEETHGEIVNPPRHSKTSTSTDISDSGNKVEATQCSDVLILFRSNDCNIPFRLRQIIMSDLRLLTLLESGLPSWVIFLQSYPVFCHLYRPWMCPLVRALYVLISVVTVLIGFYDLYKNVPVLKATVSRLCGPLFDWIETWEMISRIKYLGTMLFLHNFEKAVRWFLMVTRATKSFLLVLTQPMVGPLVELWDLLLPFWNICLQAVESFGSVIWVAIGSSCSSVMDLVEILLLPIWFILSVLWSIASSIVYPMFLALWEILYAPIRLALALGSFIAFIFSCIFDFLGDIWLSANSIFQIASASEATVGAYEVSLWRTLWNDLFSQVFRAIRSIVNGFVAFFATCNRHRLSIYNHMQDFLQRLSCLANRSQSLDSSHCRRKCGAQNPAPSSNTRETTLETKRA